MTKSLCVTFNNAKYNLLSVLEVVDKVNESKTP